MELKHVKQTKAEAERVIKRCDEWLDCYNKDEEFKRYSSITGYAISGALKRAVQEFIYVTREMRR